ncbi:PRC-barrel domain-containing protein [Candidatus Halobonum tyrrellensis]|uniref:Uncharacterized protein n=1 Tax=Candidatus Halobonum tyrrellensis G22 TaxID=1324957 RepID=V4H9U0_9EURY|nr:PRC-barrel domain-containing protein [Candidatus Halobonum tyrrellensis]ESP87460.1 hypothetical protein K933_13898 [Candidatus Halobonum tyrrellensis G22]
MARNFSDDDRDKPVYTSDGTRIGTISEVAENENTARVRRGDDDEESATDEIREFLGWNDGDESHELRGEHVDRRDENGVYLHGNR